MIFYITSTSYKQIIAKTVNESEEIVSGNECRNDFMLLKYVKENINSISQMDIILVDLQAIKDSDEEIIEAFEMIRIMAAELRIILIATNRPEGDRLLRKCFQMSIYDIINSPDYLVIREELLHSISVGNSFKDALRFKEKEILGDASQMLNKRDAEGVRIGFVGSEKRIGVTHNAIILANYLRKHGFLIALIEKNESNDFRKIMNEFEERKGGKNYFTLNSIDYYCNVSAENLKKPYNFIIEDYGEYARCDKDIFNSADIKIVIAGAKPWEIDNVNNIFNYSGEEQLKEYNFYFNFVESRNMKDIKNGMGKLDKVYFLKYAEDPFIANDFENADMIFKEYLPEEQKKQKKPFIFGFKKKRGKK